MLTVAITALAIAALPGEQKAYSITEFVKPEDCAIRRVGAKNINLCDLAPAFDRAQLAVKTALDAVDFDWLGYGDHTGSSVTIPPGLFWVSREIRLCRQMHVSGASGGSGGATFLFTPHGGSGFRVAFFDECVAVGLGEGGDNSLIENMNIFEATGVPANSTLDYAISVEASMVEIRQIQTYGFVQAIRISADRLRVPRTNANGWHVDHVTLSNSEHAALFVDGGDANAGLALAVNLKGGCVRGSYWKDKLGPCASLIDSEQIGSTYVATEASMSVDTTTKENFGNYLFQNAATKSTVVGLYSEVDLVKPQFAPNTTVLGLHAFSGLGGFRLSGPRVSGLELVNDRTPTNVVTTRLGDKAAPETGLEVVTSVAGMREIRLKADAAAKVWTVGVANTNAGVGAKVSGAEQLGAIQLPGMVSTGTPAAALCKAGAVYFEKNPVKTGPVGYQCASGAWRSFK